MESISLGRLLCPIIRNGKIISVGMSLCWSTSPEDMEEETARKRGAGSRPPSLELILCSVPQELGRGSQGGFGACCVRVWRLKGTTMKRRQMQQPQPPPAPDGQTQTPPGWNTIPLRPARRGQDGMSGLPGQDIALQRGRSSCCHTTHVCFHSHSIQGLPTHCSFPHTHVSIARNPSPLPKVAGSPSMPHACAAAGSSVCNVLSCMSVCKLLLSLQDPADMCLLTP